MGEKALNFKAVVCQLILCRANFIEEKKLNVAKTERKETSIRQENQNLYILALLEKVQILTKMRNFIINTIMSV